MAGQLAMTPFGPRLGSRVWPHLAWLAAALFLVLALGAWLGRIQYLTLTSGIIQGASYADVQARMPAALLLTVASLAGAGLAATAALTGRTGLLIGGAALYAAVLLGGEGLRRRRSSASSSRPTSRRARRRTSSTTSPPRAGPSASTRSQERELSGDAELTRADIARNRPTLDNVRLWDHQQLLETFGQIQEIRTYYDFVSVDNDRYEIGGQTAPGDAVGARAESRRRCPTAPGSTSGWCSRTATASRSAR